MRLSEIKGDKAFEVLADLIDPIKVIARDDEIKEANKISYIDGLQVALRKHPKCIRDILAILDLEDPATYDISLATLPIKAMELVSDPDMKALFTWQGQELKPSGSVTEITEEHEE